MTRTELIAALEKAEGASREIDAQLLRMRHPEVTFSADHAAWFSSIGGKPVRVRVPDYTSSIDAALTLVPEHAALWRIDQFHSGESLQPWGWSATLRQPHRRIVGESRASIAIALCIAALKAMEDKP